MSAVTLLGQTDPGPRGGAAAAGGPYHSLNSQEQTAFQQAKLIFQEIDSVSGTIAGEPGSGLGPTFNGNSCAQCHAQPAAGGSSPGLKSKQIPMANPQVALATLDGATNTVPTFITLDGPVREARFVSDGGVHGLFSIKGRRDALGCTLAQPDFVTALQNRNVVFRIPTPTYGLGLVETTPDSVLQANLSVNQSAKAALGISGRLNTTGNDGSVTRFGWKAQNKSLLIFAGEAYNVEQGVSNEAFPNERSAIAGCVYNSTPEDRTGIGPNSSASDLIGFAMFMRLSDAPQATTSSASENNGSALFNSIGCALCHTPTLTTGLSSYTGMSNSVYHPYSDFALHDMGPNLADGISQGSATGSEFRTAPLWGVGQRLFFLHDGRTSDLLQAVLAHASDCGGSNNSTNSGSSNNRQICSEGNGVVQRFNALSTSQKQDILNFLRWL